MNGPRSLMRTTTLLPLARLVTRREELEAQIEEEARHRDAHVEQLMKLFTPVRLFGSGRVKELSPAVQAEVTAGLAAALEDTSPEEEADLGGWVVLETAMRDELGIAD